MNGHEHGREHIRTFTNILHIFKINYINYIIFIIYIYIL
jgi:hypothetical protein